MGSVVGSVLGGGNQASAANNAAGILSGAANQAGQIEAKYYGNALGSLGRATNQAQAYLAPYSMGGYNALDAYLGTLGLATPAGGSFGTSQNIQTGYDLAQQLFALNHDIQTGKPGSSIPGIDGSLTLDQEKALAAKDQTDPAYEAYYGYVHGVPQAMTAANPTSALTSFFNNPLYQLQFGNSGTAVDPNANPIDRYQQSPGYQFELQQGQQALQNTASSKGLLGSAPMAKSLLGYSQGLANQDFNNYMGRLTNTFNTYQSNLANMAGLGANTSGQMANLANNYGINAAQTQQGIGTALANSTMAGAGAQAGGIINAANINAANSQAGSSLGGYLGPSLFGNGTSGSGLLGTGLSSGLSSGIGGILGGLL